MLVAFTANDDVVLRSFSQDVAGQGTIDKQIGGEDTFDLVRFTVPDDLGAAGELPYSLLSETPLEIPESATVRKFTLDGHTKINGEKMDMNRIDEVVPSGALEIWEVRSDGNPHTFHIHGATFHVLEVAGEVPPPHLRGPKDTVPVAAGREVKLAVQFVTHIDPDVPFMYHCHILKHEDNGMMGQFVIVEPGMEDTTPRTLDSGHASH
jgi:FtsP/CotA-like multicopper oxidase with cupredoxin domain